MMVTMDKLVVTGGKRLEGTVRISGSKNAVLPIMAATLLADGQYHIKNVPLLRDVQTMSHLIESIGARVEIGKHELTIDTHDCSNFEAPYDLVKTMRASVYVLGPLVSRFGYGKVSLPGGCAWGPRPVNLHIDALKKMGANIKIDAGYIIARAEKLRGANIFFDNPSVGATGNTLMAAVLAKGKTIIQNAAIEPEITSLVLFLNKMGAQIEGAGTNNLEVNGVEALHPTDCQIIPDRIETGTFLVAGHLTRGNIRLENVNVTQLTTVVNKLKQSGAHIESGQDWIHIQSDGSIQPVSVKTAVFPGFPTDMQAQWIALMSLSRGSSVVMDTIFEDRFTHVAELRRLGANIKLDHHTAVVTGVDHLSGAPVMSTDLRASASLILAGLVAKGCTHVSRVYHIDRGYEKIEKKLNALGAEIHREKEKLIT